MKTLWILSAILLILGFGVFLYSFVPQAIREPYTTWTTQTKNYLLNDGVETATSPFYSTYFSAIYNFTEGDTISITASPEDGQTPLSAEVSRYFGLEVYKSQENTTSIDMDYTIPFAGRFQITVSRYKTNDFEFFSSETSANVYITAQMKEEVEVQQYRFVTTYPYKNLEMVGIAIMLAGIGVGVLSIAQKGKSQPKQSINLESELREP